jgi:hypothetical protein
MAQTTCLVSFGLIFVIVALLVASSRRWNLKRIENINCYMKNWKGKKEHTLGSPNDAVALPVPSRHR